MFRKIKPMPSQNNSNVCDEKIFEQIHKKYAQDLYNFTYYKYGEKIDPADKVQNAFLKLWENCKDILPEKAKSFLFTVTNNLAINTFKHHQVVLKYQNEYFSSKQNNEDPSFLMEEAEYLKKYQQALSSLTPEKRATFLMCKAEGKKHQEVAELLGISRKAVEKRLYSAITELRKHIKEI